MLLCAFALPARAGTSAYQNKPADDRAVLVQGVGDGKADDSGAIQSAIDLAAKGGQGGIVFVPQGRYRLTRTILVWPGVRLFGYGKRRPVFVLGDNTPGFQRGVGTMFIFTGGDQYAVGDIPVPVVSEVPFTGKVRDANSATFYSAMSNVDFEIGEGNPAAAAVRIRTAQHSFLTHIDFNIGSGLAGIYQAGNVGYDLRFIGGRYGILAEKTSPAWQYTLLDSVFEGQRDAAIREHEMQLTLANVTIRNTPTGIEIDKGYSDQLYGKDVRFENVSGSAVLISNEGNVFTQVSFDNALAANTPVFARYRESGKTVAAAGPKYQVREFTYGLTLPGLGSMGSFDQRADIVPLKDLPKPRAAAIKPLPPMSLWTNVKSLGVKGDDQTDDTAAIQKAIDTYRVLYFPMGRYLITGTLKLRPETVLIGLHPNLTQLIIPEDTPGYRGIGAPKPLIESASGGAAMLYAIGLNTGIINPRATALMWKAGAASQVDDVRIHGGAGTTRAGGQRIDFNDPRNRWDGQYPSVMVIDGGGGTFNSVWTPNTFAQAGLFVSNTKTPATVYELSAEHHVRHEVVLDGVENWEFLAPQTEQEQRDGWDTVALEIRNSRNIRIANYHGYRVTRSQKPAPAAVRLYNSGDIRFRNLHSNAESGFAFCDENGCGTYLRASKFAFENAIQDMTHKLEVREREFAVLDVPFNPVRPVSASLAGVKVERLETGFYAISGAAVDARGALHFVERKFHRIYRWTPERGLETVRDAPLDPVNLAIDASGNIMVLSIEGPEATVYAFKPGTQDGSLTLIPPTPVADRPKALTALPVNFWNNGEFRDQYDARSDSFTTLPQLLARDLAAPKAREYVSPDGSLVLPAFRTIAQGGANFLGWRWSDTLDTYGFVTARQGQRVFFTAGAENTTYTGQLGPAGALTDLKPFANRGGESVAVGPDGQVYVANGQVWVYAPDGTQKGLIEVPERPLQLIFGGADGRTLFILTHHSLYSARMP
ncbi:glycosyl hydrolase family 28-related protein [Sphingomonas sp. LB-2]|uniref:glycosyl hydrolase family 28-related protein n=1 Tax=Sphingomonas caeni TaxID=2984949 RepID=UPI00222EEEFC|nr:glycosyl hydrolase family 28-related protein [Sphingomonas caeni]MCW3847407.1 glycosyl hydrolase family 28-related protein [Sphingomonas caeni]